MITEEKKYGVEGNIKYCMYVHSIHVIMPKKGKNTLLRCNDNLKLYIKKQLKYIFF